MRHLPGRRYARPFLFYKEQAANACLERWCWIDPSAKCRRHQR